MVGKIVLTTRSRVQCQLLSVLLQDTFSLKTMGSLQSFRKESPNILWAQTDIGP